MQGLPLDGSSCAVPAGMYLKSRMVKPFSVIPLIATRWSRRTSCAVTDAQFAIRIDAAVSHLRSVMALKLRINKYAECVKLIAMIRQS